MSGGGGKYYAYYISATGNYAGREFEGIDYDYIVPAGTPPENTHDTLMYLGRVPNHKGTRRDIRRRTRSPAQTFSVYGYGDEDEDDTYESDEYARYASEGLYDATGDEEHPAEAAEEMAEDDADMDADGVPDMEIYLGPSSVSDLTDIVDGLPEDAATAEEVSTLRQDMQNGEEEFQSVAAQLAGMPRVVLRFIRTFVRIVRSNLNSVIRYFIRTEAQTAEQSARRGESGNTQGTSEGDPGSFSDWVWSVVKLGGTALKRLWNVIKWVGTKTFQLARFMSRHPKIMAVLIRIGLVVYSQLCKRMSWWCVTNKSCMELTGLEKQYRVKRSIGGRAKHFIKDNAQEIAAVLLSGIQAYAQVALQPMVDAALLFLKTSLPAFAASGGPVTAFLAPIMGIVVEYLRMESVAVVETILVSMAVGSSMGELYIALSSKCLKQPVIVETDGRLWGVDRRECECDADCRGNGDMTTCADDGYCWTKAKVAAEGYWGMLKYHVGG